MLIIRCFMKTHLAPDKVFILKPYLVFNIVTVKTKNPLQTTKNQI